MQWRAGRQHWVVWIGDVSSLTRRALAELGGTAFLVTAVVGSEIATVGLVLVIFGTIRSGRTVSVAYAAGGYITAAYCRRRRSR